MTVDDKILGMLELAQTMYDTTDGKLNIAMGSVLNIWHNYREAALADTDDSNNQLPTQDELDAAAQHCDIHDLVLDDAARTVYLTDPEMSLDVGSVGKGYAVEMVAQAAEARGGEVGASRAAVDAGFTEHARQIGQTGVTIRPKLYIACGISGQIQHTAGMDQSSMIISINTDPDAPINKIADFAITGDLNEVIPKMIKYYKQNSK